ncbi:hypothetical protein Pint_16182 [Pistacia integerrima]|uniref:Uncharacterized protein n=1 Tax=Pistacia integerrima TaxID=434235 RepID=A0ACC0ZEF1_9ROSI|nr:hypothetical protein Pint_16182 [Pistacia integerrima]
MHLVALLVFHLDMLETMYTMLVLLGLANALNIWGRRRAAISYDSESASRFKRPFPRTQPMSGGNGSRHSNCFGALDETYIKVHMPSADIPRKVPLQMVEFLGMPLLGEMD